MSKFSSPSNKPFNLVWLRRNLRWSDNLPLVKAAADDLPVLPIFIFDTEILNNLEDRSDLRVNFIHTHLNEMHNELAEYNSGIYFFYGNPVEIFNKISQGWNIKKVFVANDFEPYAKKRDQKVADIFDHHDIAMETVTDHIVFEPDAIKTQTDNNPYKVYTPYSKQWLEKLSGNELTVHHKNNHNINFVSYKGDIIPLKKMNFKFKDWQFPTDRVENDTIDEYKKQRDFPAEQATSRLGVHLRFGTISIRSLVRQALKSKDNTFLKQLIWREFFIQIMHHYPNSMKEAFRPKYRNMPWEFNEEHFEKWKTGRTGVPMVDAGMRELNNTGFMHNRVRMIAASWLTKNLLIDWKLGERYFAEKLLDYELASNVGSWQWVAGTGVDAAPYFRIFNPFTQGKKFDPKGIYINKWVQEINTEDYPDAMIDYKASRERCIDFYKKHAN